MQEKRICGKQEIIWGKCQGMAYQRPFNNVLSPSS